MKNAHNIDELPFGLVWPVLAVVVVLGVGLRLFQLDNGLWYDEIRTLVESVRSPLADLLTHFPGNNNHPLYSVLAHLSIEGFAEHAWSLRLPAVLFGIAAIPMLYVFGTKVTSRFEAVAAAALLAVSYHHIWFSQNARGYTLLLFCALLASTLLLIGLKDKKPSVFIGYALVSALGAYTHLTMVFLVLSHAGLVAWLALFGGAGKFGRGEFHPGGAFRPEGEFRLKDWAAPVMGFVLAGLLTILFYAPMLAEVQIFVEKGIETKSVTTKVATPGWALWETLKGLQIGFGTLWAVALGGLLSLLGCWSYFRQSPLVCAIFVFPAPVLLAAAVLLQHPVRPRFFFFLMGFGLLIGVRGAVCVGRWLAAKAGSSGRFRRLSRMIPATLVLAMFGFSLLALPTGYRYPKQDFEQALRFVEEAREPRDAIVVVGAGAAFPYQQYYSRSWPKIESAAQLRSVLDEHETVWLLNTFKSYLERGKPELMGAINASCSRTQRFPGTVGGGEIDVYRCAAS